MVHYFISRVEDREEYVKNMIPLAKKYEEYLQFTTIDVNEYPEMMPVFGHKRGSHNVFSVHNPNNGDIFPYIGLREITAPVVEAFLSDIIDGKVSPFLAPGQDVDFDTGHHEL